MRNSNLQKSLESTGITARSRGGHNDEMEAIACGVQARLEERFGYSRRVIDETVSIARALGVADREINRWVDQRTRQRPCDEARLRSIKSLLAGVRRDISRVE